jgi:Flp pilus assembly protein TadD
MEYYRKALGGPVETVESHNKFGNTLYRYGHTAEAIRQYNYALKIDPGHRKAMENLLIVLRNNSKKIE